MGDSKPVEPEEVTAGPSKKEVSEVKPEKADTSKSLIEPQKEDNEPEIEVKRYFALHIDIDGAMAFEVSETHMTAETFQKIIALVIDDEETYEREMGEMDREQKRRLEFGDKKS